MRCDNCGIDCTGSYHMFASTTATGSMTKKVLCTKCATRVSLDMRSGLGYDMSDLGVLSNAFGLGPVLLDTRNEKCPVCGYTYKRIRDTGFLGCESCYQVFRAPLMSSIRDVQLATRHVGKSPGDEPRSEEDAVDTSVNTSVMEVRRLTKELECAVKEERYEDASRIQRRLKELGVK